MTDAKRAIDELIQRTLEQSNRAHGQLRQVALEAVQLSTLIAAASTPEDMLARAVKFNEVLTNGTKALLAAQVEIGYLAALVAIRQMLNGGGWARPARSMAEE